MPGNAFVVHRRHFIPEREALFAGHGQPDLSGAAEVLAGRRVVADVGPTDRSGHRLAPPEWGGDLEVRAVQIVDRFLDQLLTPGQEAVGTIDRTICIRLELVETLISRATRRDLLDQVGNARF